MTAKPATAQRYVARIPRNLPAGQVLVHNGVTPYRILGNNGFRAWTQAHDATLVQCHCEAAVDLHGHAHFLPIAWVKGLSDERLHNMGIVRVPA